MKLNEFKQIEERWDFGGINKFGNAQVAALKNKITGGPDAELDPTELRAKQIFIDKFVEKASTGLANAIKTGALSANAQPAQGQAQQPTQGQAQQGQQVQPGQPTQTTQAGQANSQTGQQTPAQIRQAKQAQASAAAQAQMTPKPGQPAQPTKMTPQQIAALKGRLKAGATATSAQSGFKNYVGGSGERMTGVDKSGAPIFKKIQRESKYQLLDAIFESILNEQTPTISSFVMDAFKAYANGPGLSDPSLMRQAETLANEVQTTYTKDKGMAALRKLGDLGYTVATFEPEQTSTQGQTQPSGQTTQSAQQQPAQGQEQAALTAPQAYNKILGILGQVDPKGQQKIVQALNQYIKMNQV